MSVNATVALAGNPNVGKSTLFNRLTGLRQHTGNWPGKTVAVAQGRFCWAGREFQLIDLPGAYSLMAHSAEEEIARDYLLSGQYGAVCVVCDATSLLRCLPLALQAMEITPNVVVCVNLMDEAAARGIQVDGQALERGLGAPVVCVSARDGSGLDHLMAKLDQVCRQGNPPPPAIPYPPQVEAALKALAGPSPTPQSRWRALTQLEADPELQGALVSGLYRRCEELWGQAVRSSAAGPFPRQLRLDRLLTGRRVGIPAMLLLMALVFYLTIAGSNLPSSWLSQLLFSWEHGLANGLRAAGAPHWLEGALVQGVYRVTAWVVSVMLPPMAIFFPLFTLLEDLGYLPRVAFNLDGCFRRCRACGKQALTMLMGFGCNAAGVTGCRIIDSPRERMIALLTNALVPCNGRFPLLILLLTLYAGAGIGGAALPALGLTALVALSVGMTFLASRLLSATLLKGMPSSFALEMPPFRRPQVGQVLARSLLDRTLFVLGRALRVAAPAGLALWVLCAVQIQGVSLAARLAQALDPAGRWMGMDGVMLAALLLGFPANELVLPIALMLYQSGSVLVQPGEAAQVGAVLAANGWTGLTALCAMLFTLFHWPCSTTLLTIKKETGSLKWTALAALLPTLLGAALCAAVYQIGRWFL